MNVILSIKPEFVEKIFSGEKQYEYRKILFKQKVDTVYIYASRPICKIVGEFKIDEILCDKPENIWKLTKRSFNANLQNIRIEVNGTVRKALVCAKCIKGNKIVKAK